MHIGIAFFHCRIVVLYGTMALLNDVPTLGMAVTFGIQII